MRGKIYFTKYILCTVPRSVRRSLFTSHSIFSAFVCIYTFICICTTICICSCICIYVFVGCAKVREAFLVLLLTLYSYNPQLLLLFPASLLYEDAKSDITRYCRHEVCPLCLSLDLVQSIFSADNFCFDTFLGGFW